MRCLNVRRLGGQHLAHWERQFLLERFCVRRFRFIFRLFRRHQQSVVAAAQRGLEAGPRAINDAACGPAFFDIVNALLVKHRFEFAAKLRAMQRFRKKKALERLVFQLVADFLESLLPVDQALDDLAQCSFNFLERA